MEAQFKTCPACHGEFDDVREWQRVDSPGILAKRALDNLCDEHRAQYYMRYMAWRGALGIVEDPRGAALLHSLFIDWFREDFPDVVAAAVPVFGGARPDD